VATDIDEDKLQGLAARETLETAVLDVTVADGIQAFFQERTGFDILFNCAGFVHNPTILDCDEEAFHKSFEINVTSMYRICRAALPAMVAAGGGSIVNMSSVASSVKAVPNRFVYSATKAAVIGMTKAIAADFIDQGIRCNAICPGTVETPSLAERIEALDGDVNDNWAAFHARQPMGRLGKPDEIAALAVYLASEEAAFTTGGVHLIDGGWAM
jgi:2-keto-3-deoxy-L-fuconate dehydrogenase